MRTVDKKTEELAAVLIARFEAACESGDLVEMEKIAAAAASTPNHPLQEAILRSLGD